MSSVIIYTVVTEVNSTQAAPASGGPPPPPDRKGAHIAAVAAVRQTYPNMPATLLCSCKFATGNTGLTRLWPGENNRQARVSRGESTRAEQHGKHDKIRLLSFCHRRCMRGPLHEGAHMRGGEGGGTTTTTMGAPCLTYTTDLSD